MRLVLDSDHQLVAPNAVAVEDGEELGGSARSSHADEKPTLVPSELLGVLDDAGRGHAELEFVVELGLGQGGVDVADPDDDLRLVDDGIGLLLLHVLLRRGNGTGEELEEGE